MKNIDISNFRVGNYYQYQSELKRVKPEDFSRKYIYGSRIPIDRNTIEETGLCRKRTNNGLFVSYIPKYKCYALCAKSTKIIVCLLVFVDQLQNVYHATTGEELSFNHKKRKRKNPLKKLEFIYTPVGIIEKTKDKIKPVKRETWWNKMLQFINLK